MRISKECIEKAVLFKNNLFDKWHCMRNMSWWWLPDTWQICHTHSHSLQPYAPPGVARTRTRSLFVPTWDDEMHITGTCVHPHAHACTDTLTLAYTLYDIHTFQIYHWPCAQGYPNRFSWQGPHIVRRDIRHSVLTHDSRVWWGYCFGYETFSGGIFWSEHVYTWARRACDRIGYWPSEMHQPQSYVC